MFSGLVMLSCWKGVCYYPKEYLCRRLKVDTPKFYRVSVALWTNFYTWFVFFAYRFESNPYFLSKYTYQLTNYTCLFSSASFSFSSSILIFSRLVVTLMLFKCLLSTKGSSHIVLPKLKGTKIQ